jgi:hypothetical protein
MVVSHVGIAQNSSATVERVTTFSPLFDSRVVAFLPPQLQCLVGLASRLNYT